MSAPPIPQVPRDARDDTPIEQRIVDYLQAHGASFFAQIQTAIGGFANDLVDAMWDLVWKGLVTNDTFHALRAYTRPKSAPRRSGFRSRRVALPSTQGRWSLISVAAPASGAGGRQGAAAPTQTERANAIAQQLLARYGVVVREAAAVESVAGGFSAIYPVLKGMEEAGRIRRGYFIAGFGATQFATAGALDLLRSFREEPEEPETLLLSATDPASPYGALLKWPAAGLMRVAGASVVLVNGALAAYLARGEKNLTVFLPEDEPSRSMVAREVARVLSSLVIGGGRRALLIKEVSDDSFGAFLADAGFVKTGAGYQRRALS